MGGDTCFQASQKSKVEAAELAPNQPNQSDFNQELDTKDFYIYGNLTAVSSFFIQSEPFRGHFGMTHSNADD